MRALPAPYSDIEYGVADLVERLNSISGVRTVASCHGHWDSRPPYVYFEAPTTIATQIERVLREDALSNSPTLQESWEVDARFNGAFQLTFAIRCPKYDQMLGRPLLGLWNFVLRRRHLDRQLHALSRLISVSAESSS